MSELPSYEAIKEKLYRALKAKAVLTERSKLLSQQIEDARRREGQNDHVLNELLDRQREMNFMLHRANSALHHIHEANSALSAEFTELVKELPASTAPDWEQRVNKINELFMKTGALADELQDEIFGKGIDPVPPPPIEKQPSESIQNLKEPIVDRPISEEPEQTSEPELILLEPSIEPDELVEEPLEADVNQSDTDPIDLDMQGRLDRLFGQTESYTPPVNEPHEEPTPTPGKSGVMSRIWRKLTGKSKKEKQTQSESEDNENETVQHFSNRTGLIKRISETRLRLAIKAIERHNARLERRNHHLHGAY